ncbi:hypothetical protein OC844_005441 [Tilletia horrida]|nr:hypothetical protein OC844_005441 [Tilletia horrida]
MTPKRQTRRRGKTSGGPDDRQDEAGPSSAPASPQKSEKAQGKARAIKETEESGSDLTEVSALSGEGQGASASTATGGAPSVAVTAAAAAGAVSGAPSVAVTAAAAAAAAGTVSAPAGTRLPIEAELYKLHYQSAATVGQLNAFFKNTPGFMKAEALLRSNQQDHHDTGLAVPTGHLIFDTLGHAEAAYHQHGVVVVNGLRTELKLSDQNFGSLFRWPLGTFTPQQIAAAAAKTQASPPRIKIAPLPSSWTFSDLDRLLLRSNTISSMSVEKDKSGMASWSLDHRLRHNRGSGQADYSRRQEAQAEGVSSSSQQAATPADAQALLSALQPLVPHISTLIQLAQGATSSAEASGSQQGPQASTSGAPEGAQYTSRPDKRLRDEDNSAEDAASKRARGGAD